MSGVYIKGLEMPEPGTVLAIKVFSNGLATVWDKKVGWKQHPAIPVPDHGRLGDLDALADKCDDPHWCVWLSDIEDAPTVIPADKEAEA